MGAKAIVAAVSVFFWVLVAHRRTSRISVSHIPGPDSESFILGESFTSCLTFGLHPDLNAGNLPEIFQSQAGVPDFKYQQTYGDVVRIKGPFGVRLVVFF